MATLNYIEKLFALEDDSVKDLEVFVCTPIVTVLLCTKNKFSQFAKINDIIQP